MLEYRAYHKTRPGNRARGWRALRKKDKTRSAGPKPLRARLRLIGWTSVALLAVGLTGVAFASAYSWITHSPIFTIRTIDMNRCANVSLEEVWAIVRGGRTENAWSLPSREVARRLSAHPWVRSASVRKCSPTGSWSGSMNAGPWRW